MPRIFNHIVWLPNRRTFAISDRDGLFGGKSQPIKMLKITQENGKYIWYIAGTARTVTDYRPILTDENGNYIHDWKLNQLYHLMDFKNQRYNCVGCPIQVHLYNSDGTRTNGFVTNPKVDLTGMPSSYIQYTVVDLPPMGSSAMPSIDNGEDTVGGLLEPYNQPGDEFYLNGTAAVDQAQCDDHPITGNAGEATPSSTAKNPNNGKKAVETAFPPIFGRTTDPNGQIVYVLFDPHMELMENTPENPLPDGGGQRHVDSQGSLPDVSNWRDTNYVNCANVLRNFMNEDGCRISTHPNACSNYAEEPYGGPIKKTGPGVIVCGQRGEVANDIALGSGDRWDLSSNYRKMIYRQWHYADYKHSAWVNVVLDSADQLRQRVAWALFQIFPIGTVSSSSRYIMLVAARIFPSTPGIPRA